MTEELKPCLVCGEPTANICQRTIKKFAICQAPICNNFVCHESHVHEEHYEHFIEVFYESPDKIPIEAWNTRQPKTEEE